MLECQTQRRSLALIDQQARETGADKQSSPVTIKSAIPLTDRITHKENLRQELLAVTQERDIFYQFYRMNYIVIGWVQLL